MSRLEELCRPFLSLVCARANFARAGVDVSPDAVKAEVRAALDAIRARCADDPVLRREFERVEKPLVFFADYCLRDGDTPLAHGWADLAREYSELSGDEKFYDMLAATLEDPDASERLRLFYVMLGLGFDGVRRGDGAYVQQRMKLCATRFAPPADFFPGLSPDLAKPHRPVGHRPRALAACLAAALAFAMAAFAYNYYRFCGETRDFRDALTIACDAAEATSTLDAGPGVGTAEAQP